MPEYVSPDGERRLGAPSDSALERRLILDRWSPVDQAVDPPAAGDEHAELRRTLEDLSRGDLNNVAAREGVEDPEKLPNKQAVVDAIVAAQTEEA